MSIPCEGQISLSQIRDEFLDDRFDNTLNEYGGGGTPFVKNSKTQRKFSDYYCRRFAIIKSTGTNPSTVPKQGNSYSLDSLFTAEEKQTNNPKIIYIDPLSSNRPYGFDSYPDQAANGVVMLNLAGFDTDGPITIVNNANIFAPGGVALLDTVTDRRIMAGGHAIEIKGASSQHEVIFVNNGKVYAGGGAGSQGGDGGFGRWVSIYNGQIEQSSGNFKPGRLGGNGAGYVNSALGGYLRVETSGTPAQPTEYQNISSSITTGEGRGGKGGDGGSFGQPGQAGDLGLDGLLQGSSELDITELRASLGNRGYGGIGASTGGNGETSRLYITVGGSSSTVVAPGGGGGRFTDYDLVFDGWPQITDAPSNNHPRIPLFKRSTDVNDFYAYDWGGGGPSAGAQGGGGGAGGAAGQTLFGGRNKTDGTGENSGVPITNSAQRPEMLKLHNYLKDYHGVNMLENTSYGTATTPGGSVSTFYHGSHSNYFMGGGAGAGYGGGNGGIAQVGGGGGGGASVSTAPRNVYAYFDKPGTFYSYQDANGVIRTVSDYTRHITTKTKIQIHDFSFIQFNATYPPVPGWAEAPDAKEKIYVQYSLDGVIWKTGGVQVNTAADNVPTPSKPTIEGSTQNWKRHVAGISDTIKEESRQNSGVYMRVRQESFTVDTGDVWAITEPLLINDTTGEHSLMIDFFSPNDYSANGVTIGNKSLYQTPSITYDGGHGGMGWILVAFTDADGNTSTYFDPNGFGGGGDILDVVPKKLLDLENGSLSVLGPEVQIKDYETIANLPNPEFGRLVAAFGYPVSTTSGSVARYIATSNKVNLTKVAKLFFKVNPATSATWGDTPDSGENLHIEYSENNSTWTIIRTITPGEVTGGVWNNVFVDVPTAAKKEVYLRYRQTASSSNDVPRDVWAVTSITSMHQNIKTIDAPAMSVNKIEVYLCGGGGGGAGAGVSGRSGGGGSGGYINTFIRNAPPPVNVNNKAETTTEPGGAAGRAVYFEGTKPTNWTYTDNGETFGNYN